MKPALLDTDTLSEFFRGNEKVVVKFDSYLRQHSVIQISVITYYEILNGLLYKDARKQLEKFKKFASANEILTLNTNIADIAAQIQADLRAKGMEVGHTDTLIAATAIYHELDLITNNTKHFKRIKNLEISNWTK